MMVGEGRTKCQGGGSPIEQFVLLAKSARGQAAAELVMQALETQGVYAFTQLMNMPHIKDLQTGEWKKYWDLINIFAYGTYNDYLEKKSNLPELNDAQRKKLQHLTIVTLSEKNKCISYSSLLKELSIPNLRELEDLIIEAIYLEIIMGKLDQSQGMLEVDTTIGRDTRESDINVITKTLESWCDACDNVLAALQTQINAANKTRADKIQRKEALENEISNLKKSVKSQPQDDDMVTDSREALGVEKTPKKALKKGIRASKMFIYK